MKNRVLYVVIIFLFILICTACNSRLDQKMNDDKGKEEENVPTYKVVIDPGHGGKDVGAIGASGQYEKSFTLSLSSKVKERLEQDPDIEVYMTRTEDRFISQESRGRPKLANDLNADLFLSIHGNTFADSSVSGTETFYYHRNSKSFAEIIHEKLVEATGFHDRGVKKENFFVVKDTEMPAVLLEVGYLTNPNDESVMLTDPFQDRVATAIVEGIREYLK
jgi:N-acetylmuramoyl-L-alanine amidase